MIRLLFVDDHPVVAEGLVSRFRATDGFAVAGAVTTMAQALDVTAKVDVALVDVQLEVLTTPAQVAALCERCRVVLFSARRLDAYVRSLLDAGAAGFLDKAVPLDVLDDTLRRVHAGQRLLPLQPDGVRSKLSAREYEVYRALAACQAPKEVAAKLGLAPSTVYCHLENVKKKLGVHTLQELVAHTFTHRDS
ncbi:MAG: response regulator transcription factor [Archangiaceae bacterium]|nr:response regulator transcription factor [Archangiaceae bacterium]